MILIYEHSIVMILTLQTQYGDDIDSTNTADSTDTVQWWYWLYKHSIVMILTLQILYSDDIDSTNTV